MFWDKKCKNCNIKTEKIWVFCPNCASPLKEEGNRKGIFQKVDKEFRQIDRLFDLQNHKLIMKDPLKSRGVSITITADNTSPPKIDVQTYGNQRHHHHHEKPVRIPKTTEEPDAKIQKTQNKQIITLNLPDVKSLEDIEIKQLQQSIEIKAFAGDKAYFKLIPIPSNAMVNNEFKNGVLKIEVMK